MSAHVLFVDDDESNLVVWEAACSDEFRVIVASNAQAALSLMRTHEVGVVLSDQRMPGTTGVELLEKMRVDFPAAVRILITAHSDLAAAVDAINRGNVRRYLRKPCALHELRAELRDSMEHYELRKRVRSMERRQLVTERVYALGLVAAGLGRELVRPAESIRESVTIARTELRDIVDRFENARIDARLVRARLSDLEARLGSALEGVERVMSIAHSVALPGSEALPDEVELNEVLRVALRIVRGEIRRRADIELDIVDVPPVRGSGTKLSQVVLNLLVNALEASTDANHRGLIRVCVRREGGFVHLEISDNGPEIPASDLPHLFDPFHASASRRGTGIGLAISKSIVEEMGGHIEAANLPRGGAFFRVVLPAAPSLRAAIARAVAPSESESAAG
ncbi:MAG TPA: ATP-binding protein [Polyangiaceae bacterium]|nr:ATP-binding protein [Polyangiaceae bacterium]